MEPTQGGPEWERNEAARALADAVAAHDPQAIEQGAHRLGDAVVNGVTSKLVSGLLGAIGPIVRSEIAPIKTHLDNSDRARRVVAAARRTTIGSVHATHQRRARRGHSARGE